MTSCIFYLAGYCQLQREHFCEYNEQERCPKYLIDNSPEDKETSNKSSSFSLPLDTYNYLEEQERYKKIATGKLSDITGIKIHTKSLKGGLKQ